jgi:hypothetical protein
MHPCQMLAIGTCPPGLIWCCAFPTQASVMRGSIVEVLAWRGRVEFLLLSEPMAREMHWVNGQAVARTYRCAPLHVS